MKTVSLNVQSAQRASRVELFVRIVWGLVSGIVLCIYGIIAAICLVIQWLIILITGKRNIPLNNIIRGYFYYRARLEAYLLLLTDERSPIIPTGE